MLIHFFTYDRCAEHDPTLKTQGKTGVDQTASTATSYTKAAVVMHRPWSCVQTEDIPSGARVAIAEGLYGSHTISSGVNQSNAATNSG